MVEIAEYAFIIISVLSVICGTIAKAKDYEDCLTSLSVMGWIVSGIIAGIYFASAYWAASKAAVNKVEFEVFINFIKMPKGTYDVLMYIIIAGCVWAVVSGVLWGVSHILGSIFGGITEFFTKKRR